MKKIRLITLTNLLFITSIFAQSPEKMSYQAVIRDGVNALVTNQAVGIQISILKDNATGTPVYVETQNPTSNTNGLITLEIGTGTTSDDFSTIDWGNGIYFIKTETDPTGGSNYTITGTSQLMSVPYALHAKTASSVTNDQVDDADADATNEIQDLADVTAIDNSVDEQLKNVTDPTDAQDAATKAYVDALETKLTALESRIEALEPPKVGDFHAGGVVFWVNPNDNSHGLVCAVSDLSSTAFYACYASTSAGSTLSSIGAGAQNTADILASCATPGTPVELSSSLTLNGYNDWFLPSRDELEEMYTHRALINTTSAQNGGSDFSAIGSTAYYWSSTEDGFLRAYVWVFEYGYWISTDKEYPGYSSRAVRAY
jgi:hypothetical protein